VELRGPIAPQTKERMVPPQSSHESLPPPHPFGRPGPCSPEDHKSNDPCCRCGRGVRSRMIEEATPIMAYAGTQVALALSDS
jgi:hypothetical protein